MEVVYIHTFCRHNCCPSRQREIEKCKEVLAAALKDVRKAPRAHKWGTAAGNRSHGQ